VTVKEPPGERKGKEIRQGSRQGSLTDFFVDQTLKGAS
jgi:hypothetical protein